MKKTHLPLVRGRTMIEMIGVLAVIGLLSLTALWGYQLMLRKHRANALLDDIMLRAVSILTTDHYLAHQGDFLFPDLPQDGTVSSLGTTIRAYPSRTEGVYAFQIEIEQVPPSVCRSLFNMNPGTIDGMAADGVYYKNNGVLSGSSVENICGTDEEALKTVTMYFVGEKDSQATCQGANCGCSADQITCGSGDNTWCCEKDNTCGDSTGNCCADGLCCPNSQVSFCLLNTNGVCEETKCCSSAGKIQVAYKDATVTVKVCIEDVLCSAGETVCIDDCCTEDETCHYGKCCKPANVCGDSCCDDGQICDAATGSCGCATGSTAYCFREEYGECKQYDCCPNGSSVQIRYQSEQYVIRHCV